MKDQGCVRSPTEVILSTDKFNNNRAPYIRHAITLSVFVSAFSGESLSLPAPPPALFRTFSLFLTVRIIYAIRIPGRCGNIVIGKRYVNV